MDILPELAFVGGVILGMFIGITLSVNKIKDRDIEISLLNEQLEKYKKHTEYVVAHENILDDDIYLDEFMEGMNEKSRKDINEKETKKTRKSSSKISK